jgi:hypothetical protein
MRFEARFVRSASAMWNSTITVPTVAFDTAFTILSAKLNMIASAAYRYKEVGRTRVAFVTIAGHLHHMNTHVTTRLFTGLG